MFLLTSLPSLPFSLVVKCIDNVYKAKEIGQDLNLIRCNSFNYAYLVNLPSTKHAEINGSLRMMNIYVFPLPTFACLANVCTQRHCFVISQRKNTQGEKKTYNTTTAICRVLFLVIESLANRNINPPDALPCPYRNCLN